MHRELLGMVVDALPRLFDILKVELDLKEF